MERDPQKIMTQADIASGEVCARYFGGSKREPLPDVLPPFKHKKLIIWLYPFNSERNDPYFY